MTDPSYTAHQKPANLATAALIEIAAMAAHIRAEVLRGADQQEIEAMRQRAHDILDSYLDLSAESAQLVRDIAHPR